MFYVSLLFLAAGNVEDYDVAKLQSIAAAIAREAGVTTPDVEVAVHSASVMIVAQIRSANAVASAAAESRLAERLPDTAAATALLGVAALSAPIVMTIGAAPSTTPTERSTDAQAQLGFDLGIAVAVGFAASAGAAILAAGLFRCLARRYARGRAPRVGGADGVSLAVRSSTTREVSIVDGGAPLGKAADSQPIGSSSDLSI